MFTGTNGKLDLFRLFSMYQPYLMEYVQNPKGEYERLQKQLLEINTLINKSVQGAENQCSSDQ